MKACGELRTIQPLIMWHLFGLKYAELAEPRCCEKPGHTSDHRGLLVRGGNHDKTRRWFMVTWDEEETYYTEAPG